MTYSFLLRCFWGKGLCSGIAVDLLQCFLENCLDGKHRQIAGCSLILVRPMPRLVVFLPLTIVVAVTFNPPNTAKAVEPSKTKASIEGRVQELIPNIEAYVVSGMKGFDIPGVAIGI